jgi:hypothetical protein
MKPEKNTRKQWKRLTVTLRINQAGLVLESWQTTNRLGRRQSDFLNHRDETVQLKSKTIRQITQFTSHGKLRLKHNKKL